jgi:hypothetical protein
MFIGRIGTICYAKITKLVKNKRNVVFLYTLVLYPCIIISQISSSSKRSKKLSISWLGIFLITLTNPVAWKIILVEFL